MTEASRPAHTYGHSPRRDMLVFVPTSAERVLDVGCNTGGFGAALKAERDIEVWGVEPNEVAAAQAAALLDRVLPTRFSAAADLPADYFDAVVFNDVLEHLIDPWQALRVAREKLRAGDIVIASIPNLRHIDCLEHILLEGDFRYEEQGVRDWTHLRFFTKKSAQRLFEESEFEVLRIEGINASWWSPSIWRRMAFRLWRTRLEDMKYPQFALVARPASRGAP